MMTRAFARLGALGIVACLGGISCTSSPVSEPEARANDANANEGLNGLVALMSDPSSTVEVLRAAAKRLDEAGQREISALIRKESSHCEMAPIATLCVRHGRLIPKHQIVLYPTSGVAGWIRSRGVQLLVSRASLSRDFLLNHSYAREPDDEFEPEAVQNDATFLSQCRRVTAEQGITVDIPALPAAEGEIVTVTGWYATPHYSRDLSSHDWGSKSVLLERVVVFPDRPTDGRIENQSMQSAALLMSVKSEGAINWDGASEILGVVRYSGEERLVSCTPSIRAISDHEFTVSLENWNRGQVVENCWLVWVTKQGTRSFFVAESRNNEER